MSDKKDNWWMEVDHQTDVESLAGMQETKQLLQENDPTDAMMPLAEDAFFARLHDRVMAGVETTTMQKDERPFWRRHQRLMRSSVAAIALFALVLTGVETQQAKPVADGSELALNDVVEHAPDVDDTILMYQSKDDFFVDLARENLNHLSVDNLQGLIRAEAL